MGAQEGRRGAGRCGNDGSKQIIFIMSAPYWDPFYKSWIFWGDIPPGTCHGLRQRRTDPDES